jgi:tetratricopeptide (TPR) repeat protein
VGEPGPGSLDELIAACEAVLPADELLDVVVAHVDVLVGEDLVHRLVPYADRLRTFDYSRHPWAALPCGVAICAVDRPRGRTVLSAGREELARQGNRRGEGFGCFLEGLQDLGEGRLDSARQWWTTAHDLLDDVPALRMIGAHLALAAYVRGDVAVAVALGEEALWGAEHANDARAETIACLGLGLFHVATGRAGRIDYHSARGLEAIEQLPAVDRYELPVLLALRAYVHLVRDELAEAEAGFEHALSEASDRGNRWFEAIIRSVRAEFTASIQPARAVSDARAALVYLDSVGEEWWSRSSRIAFATAHLAAGSPTAARAACSQLLELDLSPLERGRTLIVAAEASEAGDRELALAHAREAVELLTSVGADWWAARGLHVLSRLEPRRREYHRRRLEALAGADANDPAWQSLLRGPGRLDISLFGEPRVLVDGSPVAFQTRAELECVAMLALAPSGLPVLTVADRLWPDGEPSKVAHRLDNLVSGLRRRLEPTARLVRTRSSMSLRLVRGECDARDAGLAAVEELREPVLATAERAALAGTVRQPLLGGVEVPWVLLEHERLCELANRLCD